MLRRCTNRLLLDVVRRRRAASHPPYIVPDTSGLGGGNPRPAASTPGPPALTPTTPSVDACRSRPMGLALPHLVWVARDDGAREARDRHRLASAGLSSLLDVEISTSSGPPECAGRTPIVDSEDVGRQSALGCAAGSRRTPQTRNQRESSNGREIHVWSATTTFTDLADLPRESCRTDRGRRFLRRANRAISPAVRIGHPVAGPASLGTCGRHCPSDLRVDRPTTSRGVSQQ